MVLPRPILKKPPQWAIEQDREEESAERIMVLGPQLGPTMADGGKAIGEDKR